MVTIATIIICIIGALACFFIYAVAEGDANIGCVPLLIALLVIIACGVGLYSLGTLGIVLELL